MDGNQYQSGNASLFASAARERPDFCLDVLMSSFDGTTYEVIGIKYGETGYYPTTYERQTKEWVKAQNERLGIDEATVQAFSVCSLFGNWGNYENVRQQMQRVVSQKAHWVGDKK